MVEHAATNRDDSPNGALRRAVGLVCIWNRRLLLNAFVFVEFLKRIGCELAGSVVSNELDLLAKLRLHHLDVSCDVVFTLRLHT